VLTEPRTGALAERPRRDPRCGRRALLAKDVVVDAYQIYEARAAGADAVLLIAEALEDSALRHLVSMAKRLGLSVLVEAHEASAFGVRSRRARRSSA